MANRIMTSKRCPQPNPWNLWDMLHYMSRSLPYGSWDREIFLGYPCGPSVIRRVLTRGKKQGLSQRFEDYSAGFEDEGRSHKPRNASSSHKLGETRKQILPGATRRMPLYWCLDSPQWNPSQTFNLQNCKIICLSSAGLKLFLFSSLKLDWESGWVGFQIGNHFPSEFWGIADFSSFQCQEVDTVLVPPPLCRASFIPLLWESFFVPCVLKFYKIVAFFSYIILATQWALSIWKLCPSVRILSSIILWKISSPIFLFSVLETPVKNWIIS